MNPSMRLKVKRDTFFLPDPDGSCVYFRNNFGSFRMKGDGIAHWIENLLPMFTGAYTLEDLTDGLPEEYRKRVYEIAESLYKNGFVQDVSQDRPHPLTERVLHKYGSQIEFLQNLADSGAYRFSVYRQTKVLAAGSGPIFLSLVAALLDSGLPKFHMLLTQSQPTNRKRLAELIDHARAEDPEVAVEELILQGEDERSWRQAVQPFEAVLYVTQASNLEELRLLHRVCREEGKLFLPAFLWQQTGAAGPLVHPDAEGCWESAWRRIHQTAVCKDSSLHDFSPTAGAMLANVIVFELFKKITGAIEPDRQGKVFLLNLETLEGNWHAFLPHPLVAGHAVRWLGDGEPHWEEHGNRAASDDLFSFFSTLTSAEAGIFHIWDEEELKQLPLAQCRVQAVDPLSPGPAELLPPVVCAGLTHEEARREAGLAGLEAYVSRLAEMVLKTDAAFPPDAKSLLKPDEWIGVGAGETMLEGVCRGLDKWLAKAWRKQTNDQPPLVSTAHVCSVEDERCRFYLQALAILNEAPTIGLGAEVLGFPTVWVGACGQWYGSTGLTITLALRKSLQVALQNLQNQGAFPAVREVKVDTVRLVEQGQNELVIPACAQVPQKDDLQSAVQKLRQNGKRLFLLDLTLEPFLRKGLAGVFGVLVREEESE